MPEIVKTMKLHIHVSETEAKSLEELTTRYAQACTFISEYVFDHSFILNFMKLQEALYQTIRTEFGLKSQFTISAFKTVTARYKTVQEQLSQNPYRYQGKNGEWQFICRTLEWLPKPIVFRRPQADLVRGRDYSFVTDKNGQKMLSLNTLEKRIRVSYDLPKNFKEYFDGKWSFGTGKLVSMNGKWYFHIPMTKSVPREFSMDCAKHVVGIDRGIRFLVTSYDEKGKVSFISGKEIQNKRETFQKVRAELQAKGTKSAKRALKRISGRENRWMSDVNHRISKTLVNEYGTGTLFVLEDLKGVSFSEDLLGKRSVKDRQELRTWTFYQFEQDLKYKAQAAGSQVLKVRPDYTSQRCPKCGRIRKENRRNDIHEYVCDCCGYRSNDDRVGAMNIQLLGTMYASGDSNPRFGVRKVI